MLFIIISILLGACKGQGRFQSMLDTAASVVNNRPDSTLFLLDSLSPDYHNFSKSTRMRYHLLMLMAQNKCDTIFHNDSLQKALVNYFDHHGTPNEKMWAHYLLGRAFYDMGEALPAISEYNTAIASADTTSSDCDYWNLCRVRLNLVLLLYYQNLPYELLSELDGARNDAVKAGDKTSEIICYEKKPWHMNYKARPTPWLLPA